MSVATGHAPVILPARGTDPVREVPRELPDFDLGELARNGIEPPVLICGGMLYADGVHCLAGTAGGGKTTLAAHWMLQHLRSGGSVMLLDEESGPKRVARKFLDLGATPEEMRPPRLTYCPFPARGWNAADVLQLHERMAERRPGIVVWDSAAAFLALTGADENKAMDIRHFWDRVFVPLAREFTAAVVVIDHTGKGDNAGYGRGTSGKKDASDVLYLVETVKRFSREHDGILRLTTWPGKDREGYLADAYRIHVRTGGTIRLDITPEDAAEVADTVPDMPPARKKLLEALEAIAAPDRPASVTELVDWIARKHGHGLKRPTCSTHLNALARAGLADSVGEGEGSPKGWFPTRQQTGADGSDLQEYEFQDPPDDLGCQQGVTAGTRFRRSDPSARDDASLLTPPETRLSASPPPLGGDDDGSGATPWPPCEHPNCWDALAGRCLTEPREAVQ